MLPFNQMLRTRVAYQSDSDAIPVARVEGITTRRHPSGRRHDRRRDPGDESRRMDVGGEHAARGPPDSRWRIQAAEAGAAAGGGGGGASPEQLDELNRLLERARLYAKVGPARTVDWKLEPFLPMLDQRQALFVDAGTESAIREAVAWAERNGVRIVIRSGADAQRVAGFLKVHNVPVILTSVLTLPTREDAFHAYTYQTPACSRRPA